MSNSAQRLSQGLLMCSALLVEGYVINTLLWAGFDDLRAVLASGAGVAGLVLHLMAALLFTTALGGFLPGDSEHRASVVVFYFVITFVFPGVGFVGAAAFAAMLTRGTGQTPDASSLVVGNPITAPLAQHAEPHRPHHDPLASTMRSLDAAGLRRMILGLRPHAFHRGAGAILRRFQQNRDSEVQFYAQSTLSETTEKREAWVRSLRARVGGDPEDSTAQARLAELALHAANRFGESYHARRRAYAEALEHLAIARDAHPRSDHLLKLELRAKIGLRQFDGIDQGIAELTRVERDPPGSVGLTAERLLKEHRWGELIALAGDAAEHPDPALRESLRFWRGAGRPDAETGGGA